MLCTWQVHQVHSPLAITKLMEDGQAASMKSQRTGLICCLTGSSCFMEEIHKDMGRSLACFFTLQRHIITNGTNGATETKKSSEEI